MNIMNPARDIIIENERDKRVYQWLMETVDEKEILLAIAKLPGQQKTYLSNIIKILNLNVPKSVIQTPKVTARKNLTKMLNEINRKMNEYDLEA
jgi:hypothetical protein